MVLDFANIMNIGLKLRTVVPVFFTFSRTCLWLGLGEGWERWKDLDSEVCRMFVCFFRRKRRSDWDDGASHPRGSFASQISALSHELNTCQKVSMVEVNPIKVCCCGWTADSKHSLRELPGRDGAGSKSGSGSCGNWEAEIVLHMNEKQSGCVKM